MESILRKWLDKNETDAAPAPLRSEPAPARVERIRAAEPCPQPTPSAPPPVSPSERRLKLIIESAPVGLMMTDPAGHVLAANRAWLALFGIDRLDVVLGKSIGTLIAPEHGDHVASFVTSVCSGKAGSLEFEAVRANGTRCTLETHAVAIRKGEGDAMAFLAVTWDVTARNRTASALAELESKCALLESERSALQRTLDEAHRAAADVERDRQVEQARIDQAVRDAESRTQASLTEAEDRHALLASQWAGERETLATRLREGEERQAVLSAEVATEREGRRTVLEAAEQKYQAASAAAAAALRAERARSAQLLHEREAWRATLLEMLRGLDETGDVVQRPADEGRSIRLVAPSNLADYVVGDEAGDALASADTTAGSEQESAW